MLLHTSCTLLDHASATLKDHLMEELDYSLLPEPAWVKILAWFDLSEGSQPIAKCVQS